MSVAEDVCCVVFGLAAANFDRSEWPWLLVKGKEFTWLARRIILIVGWEFWCVVKVLLFLLFVCFYIWRCWAVYA